MHCAGIRNSPARNVECGTVCGCRDGHGKPSQHRHAAIKSHQFQRDLALIVIHGDYRVDLAALRFQEHRVRWPWAVNSELPPREILHRRTDYVDFLSPEIPAVAGMGIQRCHRDPGPLQTTAGASGRSV